MRVMRVFLIVLLLLLLGLMLASSITQTYAMESPNFRLDWLVPLSGGGGASESANYAVHMTVGQTAVGSAEGTAFRANMGYWFGVLRDWWTSIHLPIILR